MRCESRQLDFYRKWHQHLDLLTDSDFSLVEPILALRSSIQETLLKCETDSDRRSFLSSTYSSHLMELCRLARAAGNTQLSSVLLSSPAPPPVLSSFSPFLIPPCSLSSSDGHPGSKKEAKGEERQDGKPSK
ncbi:serine-protein kinase ATM isoform X1, partial [Tachysurus ichikawai]